MTIYEQKKQLRSLMRSLIKEIYTDETVRFKHSRKTAEKLVETKVFREADIVFIYVPKQPEADDMFVEWTAEFQNKKICVPKVTGDGQMEFFYLDNKKELYNQLIPGAFGIYEPSDELEQVCIDSSLADKKILMVVPGIAFTLSGKRLGQGKGFYDRFIPRLKSTGCKLFTVGFCYPEQIVKAVPFEQTDIVLDGIISSNLQSKF